MTDKAIIDYIRSFVKPEHPVLIDLMDEEMHRGDVQPSIGYDVGRLVAMLVRLVNAQHVIEFGTSLGFSTVQLALALKETGGRLISVEKNPAMVMATRNRLQEAGVESEVHLVEGDAAEWVKRVSGPFDMILQDSDKALYPPMLEDCIQQLRPYGILVADDTLFKPMGIPDRFAVPVDEYNRRVFADRRLYSTILPIGDGVTVSIKVG